MCMEVFLIFTCKRFDLFNFLHVHGGVSLYSSSRNNIPQFSPCAWRCFLLEGDSSSKRSIFSMCMEVFLHHSTNSTELMIFSMCMEVFPKQTTLGCYMRYFLHVHGGVSDVFFFASGLPEFSPCAWRCFHTTI